MSRMIIKAVVDVGYASIGGNEGIGLLISVTDADGRPYTGLQQQNFQVQLMFDWFEGMPTNVFIFDEENKQAFMQEHVPGIYGIVFNNANNVWSPTLYSVIIKVKEDQNHGQTIVQFRVPQ